MAVSYRQGCEAAAATALSDGMVLAHTHRCTHSFTNEIEAECVRISIPTHTHPHILIYTASD